MKPVKPSPPTCFLGVLEDVFRLSRVCALRSRLRLSGGLVLFRGIKPEVGVVIRLLVLVRETDNIHVLSFNLELPREVAATAGTFLFPERSEFALIPFVVLLFRHVLTLSRYYGVVNFFLQKIRKGFALYFLAHYFRALIVEIYRCLGANIEGFSYLNPRHFIFRPMKISELEYPFYSFIV